MAELSRFIQFNNEQINPRQMLQYEQLSKALSNTPSLQLTERQLIELKPQEQQIAMSVFWRHRSKQITHLGRLSDIYLLSIGFWREFNVRVWLEMEEEFKDHPYKKLIKQLALMIEEFRLMDVVEKKRPGTKQAFETRRKAYIESHKHRFEVNGQKGFIADSFLSYLFLAAHEGMIRLPQSEVADQFEPVLILFQEIYDVRNTTQSIALAVRTVFAIEEYLARDLVLDYYALMDAIPEAAKFHEHKGVTEQACGDKDNAKETIEQLFRTWHRETQEENGVHLRYELERGNAGKALSIEAEEGQEGNQISEEGVGSASDSSGKVFENDSNDIKKLPRTTKQAKKEYGEQNANVIFEEKRIEPAKDFQSLEMLSVWRKEQSPSVKALTAEFRKRMAQKEIAKRDHLTKGRLNASQLMSLVLDEHPKPFYQKNAKSKELDAVFGLLIDGSASMMDKMDETKKAVLLFHDVLRQMKITHEIVSFYEDAYEATAEVQPNTFEWLHKLQDGQKDNGLSIMSLEPHEDNRDGFAIRWMMKQLKNRDEKHRFLLIFSDGEPSAFDYAQNGIKDTAEAVLEAEKYGIQVLHLFLNTDMPSEEQLHLFHTIYGTHTVSANSVEKFTEITIRLLRKLISLVISAE
ncbi:vWA domain-containing protein [Rummeliibacillus stabekisii]|uniref:VWA domain-containing protein n=1 Tax=Rummeliibacillus stabekisii TaxID=241244 RepID=A0A143HCC1_9BACL|nr:VWA domain-containing protein [Rummeliibacillus stabekisii]AMW99100.1 VWA domain-containing protein [Rummeliibacillus stabekisii]